MTLKSVGDKHFYVDDRLIDTIWIERHGNNLVNAANYHEVNRSINWLKTAARRLAAGDERPNDETNVRKRLATLGLDYYLKDS